jgi:hypothetical protein
MQSERSKANRFTTLNDGEAEWKRRTGLMNFALRNQGMKSVKKKKLFERSEFFFFSSASTDFSKIRAALIFCFFCIKAKEKGS